MSTGSLSFFVFMTQTPLIMLPSEEFKSELAEAVAKMVLAEIAKTPRTPSLANEFLTTGEVMQILRITAPTLRKLRKSGKVKTYGEGTHHQRFRRSEIEQALTQ